MATLTYPRPASLGHPSQNPATLAGKRAPSIIARCLQAVGLKTTPPPHTPPPMATSVAPEDLRQHLLQAVSDVERHIKDPSFRD
ncbi:hypothetical protein GCM10027396_08740 [Insolitispirillum peregrinum]